MKSTTILFFVMFSFLSTGLLAQTKPKPKQKQPSQAEMNKMMEDAMKAEGMSKEEQEEMKKLMKDVMPVLMEQNAKTVDYAVFTDNKQLIPKRDAARINAIAKKTFTNADVTATTAALYNKLMLKAAADEKAIIVKIFAKEKTGGSLMAASIIAFLQSHFQAAMGLAMKAVVADPKNINYQNNLAAILSQSGYPEKAIPYLKKLQQQLPGNSSINNNLGFAWLNLGEVDSAKRFYGMAALRNPANPETKLCAGLFNEIKGDPIKAVEDYVEAFEEIPNPFTENMINNQKAGKRIEKMDFEKLKQRISIHEFFTKKWIELPQFSNSVTGFNNDESIKKGYDIMHERLEKKLEELQEAAAAELDALMDKGQDEFVKTMAKENIKGVNMMSKPALYITKMLATYQYEMMQKHTQEYAMLENYIDEQRKIKNKTGKNDKCPDFDRKANEFMQAVNPRIKEFHQKRLDEFRTWLNAWCTWRWYLTGNVKNVVINEYVGWVRAMADLHQHAVEDLKIEKASCVESKENSPNNIAELPIPSFNCPVVVSMPVGLEVLRLSAEASALNENNFGIKQNGGAMPNVSISFGVGKTVITEPGLYGNPYIKTANGSINQSGYNYADNSDDELVPLPKIPPVDELTPLDPKLLDNNKNQKVNKEDAQKLQQAKLARQLLNKMMTADCSGKKEKEKFTVGLGELVLEPVFEVGLGELELWDDEMKAWVNSKDEYRFEDGFTVGLGKLELLEIETNGLQTTITNGLEAIGTSKNFIKGLFD